jgi:16S rRNA G527 N7-methylase RsmG
VLRITCFSGPLNTVLLSRYLCGLTVVVLFSAELVKIDKFLLYKITATNEHSHNKQTNTKNNETYVVSTKETTLIGCISDVVQIRACGSNFITLKE